MEYKKTILMLPSWFPTKDNPFQGSFFKEQALILNAFYNFLVLHYKNKTVIFITYIIKHFFLKNKIKYSTDENNITEYTLNIYVPLYYKFYNKIFDIIHKKKIKTREDGIGSYIPQKYISFLLNQIRRILNNTKNFNYDFVYGVTAQDKAIYASIFSKAKKVPYVLAEHGPFPWPGTALSDQQKIAIENCNVFLAISNDKIRQVLLQNIHLKNIKYIGNLVDETKFPCEPISHDTKTFVIVAANSFYKQFGLFIQIFNELKSITQIPFKVIVAGYNANKGYSKNADILINQLKTTTFYDDIELIPSIPREELYKLYNRSDCFIMTSIQEGQPVSALEAACCGLPIFSTRCGGVEDYVEENIGRIFNISDYKNFAIGLADFLEGKITFDKQIIRKAIINKFGKQAFTYNFSTFFEEI